MCLPNWPEGLHGAMQHYSGCIDLSFPQIPRQKMCPLACKHRWAACLQLLNVNNPCVWPQHHKAGMAVLVGVWRQ